METNPTLHFTLNSLILALLRVRTPADGLKTIKAGGPKTIPLSTAQAATARGRRKTQTAKLFHLQSSQTILRTALRPLFWQCFCIFFCIFWCWRYFCSGCVALHFNPLPLFSLSCSIFGLVFDRWRLPFSSLSRCIFGLVLDRWTLPFSSLSQCIFFCASTDACFLSSCLRVASCITFLGTPTCAILVAINVFDELVSARHITSDLTITYMHHNSCNKPPAVVTVVQQSSSRDELYWQTKMQLLSYFCVYVK